MRRADREIKDDKTIDEIIDACDCMRIGFKDRDGVYILPLNFGYVKEDGKRIFYFHGANEGKKVNLMKEQAHIGFEMDTNHMVHEAESACGYSFRYSSIIGQGDISIVYDLSEKRAGLEAVMKHYTRKADWDFKDEIVNKTGVFKLEVTEIACKLHS